MFKQDFDLSRTGSDGDLWFIMRNGEMLLKKTPDGYIIPCRIEVSASREFLTHPQYFGLMGDIACFIAELADGAVSHGFELKGIGELFLLLENELILVAGCAAQLIRWDKSHQYCGRCGQPTENLTEERAKKCTPCDLIYYPRLSPAVIVAVTKEDKLLLARSGKFPTKFYSVLAGFVEPGETLEECVAREVYEEVGIVVKDIRYYGSQPWPFPDSLMLGFTAEYEAGDIKIDETEIVEANWYAADALPNIPPGISIARHLIDGYVEKYGTPSK
jgi:NAD+ diphosphatase